MSRKIFYYTYRTCIFIITTTTLAPSLAQPQFIPCILTPHILQNRGRPILYVNILLKEEGVCLLAIAIT